MPSQRRHPPVSSTPGNPRRSDPSGADGLAAQASACFCQSASISERTVARIGAVRTHAQEILATTPIRQPVLAHMGRSLWSRRRTWPWPGFAPGEECHLSVVNDLGEVNTSADCLRVGRVRATILRWALALWLIEYRSNGLVSTVIDLDKDRPSRCFRSNKPHIPAEYLPEYHLLKSRKNATISNRLCCVNADLNCTRSWQPMSPSQWQPPEPRIAEQTCCDTLPAMRLPSRSEPLFAFRRILRDCRTAMRASVRPLANSAPFWNARVRPAVGTRHGPSTARGPVDDWPSARDTCHLLSACFLLRWASEREY